MLNNNLKLTFLDRYDRIVNWIEGKPSHPWFLSYDLDGRIHRGMDTIFSIGIIVDTIKILQTGAIENEP